MNGWSIRIRMTLAVTATVCLSFVVGTALLATLTAVEDNTPAAGQIIDRLEDSPLSDRLEDSPLSDRLPSQIETKRSTIESVARQRVILSGLAAAVIAAGVGWVLVGRALAPLERLRVATADIAAGAALNQRVPVDDGPRETDDLARAVNELLDQVEIAAG